MARAKARNAQLMDSTAPYVPPEQIIPQTIFFEFPDYAEPVTVVGYFGGFGQIKVCISAYDLQKLSEALGYGSC